MKLSEQIQDYLDMREAKHHAIILVATKEIKQWIRRVKELENPDENKE